MLEPPLKLSSFNRTKLNKNFCTLLLAFSIFFDICLDAKLEKSCKNKMQNRPGIISVIFRDNKNDSRWCWDGVRETQKRLLYEWICYDLNLLCGSTLFKYTPRRTDPIWAPFSALRFIGIELFISARKVHLSNSNWLTDSRKHRKRTPNNGDRYIKLQNQWHTHRVQIQKTG